MTMFTILRWHRVWINLVVVCACVAYRPQPSHVVFIMVDDMGWNDVSFHGSDQIQTPNIDTLAYQGVILQQYYSEAICTPARSALLTGKYPMRIGMHGIPLLNAERRGIPLTERLLPAYLKDLGYSTHLVGKWHVGMSMEDYLPTFRGYDTHYGIRGGAVDYYTYNKIEQFGNGSLMVGLDLFDNEIPQDEEQRYIVDALTDRALKIINNHDISRPLFLHLTHNAPHAGNDGSSLQPPLYTNIKNRHIANTNRRLYAEIVTHLDRSIGRITKALADKDILDDTIIVFVSDNGAPTVGMYANWGVNLPFRGIKSTPWEAAVRVPAFIWHSSFRPRVWEGLMHITDWLPTLISAAGGQITAEIDGVNQWDSIVQDGESKRKEVLIAVEDDALNAYAAYRAGDYKIVVGNVTGGFNGYYGVDYMTNRIPPPEYYSSLRSCDVSKSIAFMGSYLDYDEVIAMRRATAVRQMDTVVDATPCEPTPTKGCLFNVRLDPAERHDLWQRANKIATLLTSRLRGLWAQQMKREPPVIDPAANPSNFGYRWMPWMANPNDTSSTTFRQSNIISDLNPISRITNQISNQETTIAGTIQCEGPSKNFLCILKSVF